MRISDWSSDVGAADRGERLTGHSPGADSGGAGLVLEDRPGEYVVRAEGTPALVAALTAWLAERDLPLARSEERRVGKACVSTWRSRWAPYHVNKHKAWSNSDNPPRLANTRHDK